MPRAIRITAGGRIIESDRSRCQPFENGWMEVTEEEYTAALATPRPMYVEGEIVSGPEPEPAPVRWSKLKVIDALNSIGMLPVLLSYLGSDPTGLLRLRFDAAQCIMSNDPMVPLAIPVIAQMSGKTEAEVHAILDECRDAA